MFLLFLALWIIFNERLTWEVLIIGLVVSALVELFVRLIIKPPHSKRLFLRPAFILGMFKYVRNLLFEIFRCNFKVIRLIVSPKYEVEPELIYFRTRLKSDAARVALANSITLTPGTITCKLAEDRFCVHTLDHELGEGVEDSDFEKQLLKLEEMSHDS